MLGTKVDTGEDLNPQETSEWLEALDGVVEEDGPERASYLLDRLTGRAALYGATRPIKLTTPYVNTIPVEEEVPYPGNREIERRIKSLIRWNAMAMVVRANKHDPGIGGHISTFASLATLAEVGHNHFFHARYDNQPGDFVYFQGHASPGTYARAFLEGRITQQHLENFRHELREHPGLSSYPHPWLMPDFWQFPTVSMGLGPINAIYQARFMRYLEHREIIPVTPRKIWAFVGDGETDEPETLGSITLASRENLDNLIFVVNCNLQRLDGPGARQRPDHYGTRSGLSRRGLERYQGPVGIELGRTPGARHHRLADQAHGRGSGRRVSELQGPGRRLRPQGIFREISGAAKTRRTHDRRASVRAAARRPRSAESL